MDVVEARTWVIKASLVITGAEFLFFLVAPALGYPLEYPEAVRLLEILVPVFFGYLGSATHFLFGKSTPTPLISAAGAAEQLGLLVRGPVLVWGTASAGAIFAFGYTNRLNAGSAPGMNIDQLAGSLAIAMGLLTVTTNIVVSYLFGRLEQEMATTPHTDSAGGEQNG